MSLIERLKTRISIAWAALLRTDRTIWIFTSIAAGFFLASCIFNYFMYKGISEDIWYARSECSTYGLDRKLSSIESDLSDVSRAVGAYKIMGTVDSRLDDIDSNLSRLRTEISISCSRY